MGTALERGQGAPDSEYGTPDNHERQAILAESSDALVRCSSFCILHGMHHSQEHARPLLPSDSCRTAVSEAGYCFIVPDQQRVAWLT